MEFTETRTFEISERGTFILTAAQLQIVRESFDDGWAKIHAIKALRNTDTFTLGLHVSKRIVDRLWGEWTEGDRTFEFPEGGVVPAVGAVTLTAVQIASLKEFHTSGRKILCIKSLKEATGLRLKEAKWVVDRLWVEWGPSLRMSDLMPAVHPQRQDSLQAQLQTVLSLATRAGCYDAHAHLLDLLGIPS